MLDLSTGGQLDLLLLSIVDRGPAHGYALVELLRQRSGGALDVPEGSVYPALYRLERDGLLASREALVSGRRRRIYELTGAGRHALADRSRAWDALVVAVRLVTNGGPTDGVA